MSDLFGSVKMAELPPVWVSLSRVILLFVGMCLSIFPFGLNIFISIFATCITYYSMQIFRIRTKAYCLFSSSPSSFPLMFGISFGF